MVQILLVHRPHIAFGVQAIAACPSGNLAHFGCVQGSHGAAVKLVNRREQDAANRQVQAHANRIGGHQHIGLALGKALGLGAAHFRSQRAVNGGDFPALGAVTSTERQDVLTGKGHHRVAFGNTLSFTLTIFAPPPRRFMTPLLACCSRRVYRIRHDLQRGFAFGKFQLHGLFHGAHQTLARTQDGSITTDKQGTGRNTDQGCRPGPTALLVLQHLNLVQDGHTHFHRGVHHLNRAGSVLGTGHHHALFARHQIAGDARVHQTITHLHGQQSQRSQIHAGSGFHQGFQGLVRLARIGRAQTEHQMAADASGQAEHFREVAQAHQILSALLLHTFQNAAHRAIEQTFFKIPGLDLLLLDALFQSHAQGFGQFQKGRAINQGALGLQKRIQRIFQTLGQTVLSCRVEQD